MFIGSFSLEGAEQEMAFLFSLSIAWNTVKLTRASVVVQYQKVTCRMEATSEAIDRETEGPWPLDNPWDNRTIIE